ncbi:MAG TPA: alpha/beta fold hydrolase, partial [Thermoanaerobaculia bacterium]
MRARTIWTAVAAPPQSRRAVVVATVLLAGLFIYLRPLTVFFGARKLYLLAIGMRGEAVQLGAHRIAYITGGEGPPLVHGVAMRGDDWAPLLRALTREHRVYALDLLGYGNSDKPEGAEYSIAQQSEIVRQFLDAKQIGSADIVGVSMGGWIAAKLAAEHPHRVKRLVLVSSAGFAYPNKLGESSFSPMTLKQLRESLRMQTDQAERLPDFIARDFLRRSRQKSRVVRASMKAMLTGRDLVEGK